MMSGTVRIRKQWQVQDGPKGTLRRLRNQLAEDGCVESQVVLARRLLDESRHSGDWSEQTTQAVYWLIRASECGSEEAASLLKKCYRSGTGITKENFSQVRSCLNMSQDEKALRIAARELFLSLTPFGQDFVTTNQLQTRLSEKSTKRSVDSSESPKLSTCKNVSSQDSPDSSFNKWYEDSGSGIFDGQCLTEAKIIEAASRLARGEVPDVSLLEEHYQDSHAFHNRFLSKLSRYWSMLPSQVLDVTAKQGEALLIELRSWNRAQTVAIVLLCNALSLDIILPLLPTIIFFLAFTVMCLSTVQLLRHRRSLVVVEQWVHLFRTANSELDAGRLNGSFRRRLFLRCYGRFFSAALVAFVCRVLTGGAQFFRSELSVLAAGLALACLVGIDRLCPRVVLFGTVLIVTAATQLKLLPIDNWSTKIELSSQITMQLSIGVCPWLVVITYLAWVIRHDSWSVMYRVVLPDTMALVWSQMAGTLLSAAELEWTGLARGALLWITIFTLPLLLTLVFSALGLYALWSVAVASLNSDESYYSFAVFAALMVVAIVWQGRRMINRRMRGEDGISQLEVENVWWRHWLPAFGFVLVAVLALLILHSSTIVPELDQKAVKLESAGITWDTYHRLCLQPARSKQALVTDANRCARFAGTPVHWRGQIRDVSVSTTANRLEDLLELLPTWLSEYLRCAFGDKYEQCDGENVEHPLDAGDLSSDNHFAFWHCKALADLKDRCHVRHWDRQDFEITLRIRSEGYWNSVTNVQLRADDVFRDFLVQLVPGDEVSFCGVLLRSGLGVPRPTVQLRSIACEDCSRSDLKPFVGGSSRLINVLLFREPMKFIFDHLFYPVLEYRTTSGESS